MPRPPPYFQLQRILNYVQTITSVFDDMHGIWKYFSGGKINWNADDNYQESQASKINLSSWILQALTKFLTTFYKTAAFISWISPMWAFSCPPSTDAPSSTDVPSSTDGPFLLSLILFALLSLVLPLILNRPHWQNGWDIVKHFHIRADQKADVIICIMPSFLINWI